MAAHTHSFIDPTQGPSMRKAVGPHLLPDMRKYLVRLDYQKLQGKREKPELISQLLSKGLPMRCLIRLLGPFLSNCVASCTLCKTLLMRASLCSLGGLYTHCERAAPADLLFSLTASFYYHQESSVSWFMQDSDDLRHLWLGILQEYIVYAVQKIPSLHQVLLGQNDWASFHHRTVRTMDNMRAHFYETRSPPYMTNMTPKQVIEHIPVTPAVSTPFHVVISRCTNRVWGREVPALYEACVDFVDIQNRLLKAYMDLRGEVGLLRRLEMYGIDTPTLRKLACIVNDTYGCSFTDRNTVNLEAGLAEVMHADPYAFAAFHQEIKIINTTNSTSVHPLPCHIFKQQVLALHAADTGGVPVSDVRIANMMICTCCGKIQSAVAGGVDGKATSKTFLGSTQVVYDYCNQQIVCNGGHSSRSTEYKADRQFYEGQYVKVTSRANLFTVTNRVNRCRQTPVAIIPMIGTLVQHKDHTYTCCCHCGRLMCVTRLVTDPCICCRQKKVSTSRCDVCDTKRVDLSTRFVWSMRYHDVIAAKKLCNRCTSVLTTMHQPVPNWEMFLQYQRETERRRITRVLRRPVGNRVFDRSSGS